VSDSSTVFIYKLKALQSSRYSVVTGHWSPSTMPFTVISHLNKDGYVLANNLEGL